MIEVSRTFPAMNTDITGIIATDVALQFEADIVLETVEILFANIEKIASRFRSRSELSRLNGSAGQPFQVSSFLFTLITRSLDAARKTDGIFDPTIWGSLLAAGYDKSFERLGNGTASEPPIGNLRPYSWRDIEVNTETRTVLLPDGCGLDLGGIGKGWAVDLAADTLQRFGNFAIDAGGDIYAKGLQSDGNPWTVGVENPFYPGEDIFVCNIQNRAVATSTTMRRRWQHGGNSQHHLIDPRTGMPSQSGIVSSTVFADTVSSAEVFAKTALILGPQVGAQFLEQQLEVSWVLVLEDGSLQYSDDLSEAFYEN